MLFMNSSSNSNACALPSTAARRESARARCGAVTNHAFYAPSKASRALSCLHLSGCTMSDSCSRNGGRFSISA